jgi:cystathionine gamma-synthase/cystathionine gamma-lyase/cystathionine beta-lyase
MNEFSQRMETLAVHAGERRPGPEGSVVYPIFQGTVYETVPGTDYHEQKYIRLNSTPTQRYLHDKLAALEGAEAALGTGSGMAALGALLLTHLQKGDHLIAGDVLYGGTHDFITHDSPRLGWSYTFVDPQRPETWAAAVRPETRLFLVETITNPLMRVPRLREVTAFSRERGLVSVVDNTLASPVNFRPLAAGFDLAFHSATKYLNGHSDIVAGCVVGRREAIDRVRRTLNHHGGTLDPHAAFLMARGLKTLALRVRAQNDNALAVARFLAQHPKVAQVNHPGLESHPDHAYAASLLKGFGGMLSFRPKGGADAAARLLKEIRIPYVAPSLGGIESLITRPVTTSHAGMKREDRERIGVTDDLVRLSVGIEAPEDLIEDFRTALERIG